MMTTTSRRDFLKGSATMLAAISAVTGTGIGTRTFEAAAAPAAGAVWKSAFCAFCHFPACATKVKVVDGVAVEIMGDKASETNQGRLCLRGLSALQNLYTPYRVKAPMKRTNPQKGLDIDPGWVEISWDEALDKLARKLKATRDATWVATEKDGDQEYAVNRTDAIALLGGAQNTNEECYAWTKLGRLLGTNYVEHQARL
jgi:formate dehydrogenase major subunit